MTKVYKGLHSIKTFYTRVKVGSADLSTCLILFTWLHMSGHKYKYRRHWMAYLYPLFNDLKGITTQLDFFLFFAKDLKSEEIFPSISSWLFPHRTQWVLTTRSLEIWFLIDSIIFQLSLSPLLHCCWRLHFLSFFGSNLFFIKNMKSIYYEHPKLSS